MNLLILTGPTATGKTSLALKLSQAFPADLISCDSRQIYQHLDIITGKDIPKGFQKKLVTIKHTPPFSHHRHPELVSGYRTHDLPQPPDHHPTQTTTYSNGHTSIYGYDLLTPDQPFSSAHFLEFFHHTLQHILSQNRLPIVIGGTGYYLKTLFSPPDTLFIPNNPSLRSQLLHQTPTQLLTHLHILSPTKANSLNSSDRSNPHRLLRAIEVATHLKSSSTQPPAWFTDYLQLLPRLNPLWIGLTAPTDILYSRIDKRVLDRLGESMDHEIQYLQQHDYLDKIPAQTIGYRQWIQYLSGQITRDQAIQQWQYAEHAYARRQRTWFKSQPQIHWYDITTPSFQTKVVNQVTEWYTQRK